VAGAHPPLPQAEEKRACASMTGPTPAESPPQAGHFAPHRCGLMGKPAAGGHGAPPLISTTTVVQQSPPSPSSFLTHKTSAEPIPKRWP